MKYLKALNKKARRMERTPDVFAYSPLPVDCAGVWNPGIEVHHPEGKTQDLCSPFTKDTTLCGHAYGSCWWPGQVPDSGLNVEETGAIWESECNAGGALESDWQKLRFVYSKGGKYADAWDQSDKNDLHEIYIKDNWADNGSEPSSGNPWESPDIAVNLDSGISTKTLVDPANDPIPENGPIVGKNNFIYARVRNIGHHSIDHIYVKFYAHLHALSPNPEWRLVGHAMVRDLAAGSVQIVRSIKPWVPSEIGPVCMMVLLDSTQDPIKMLGSTPAPGFTGYDEKAGVQPWYIYNSYEHITNDNNVAQKNMTAVLAVPGWHRIMIKFEIRPIPDPRLESGQYSIEIERHPSLEQAAISLHLPENFAARSVKSRAGILNRFTLTQGQLVPASLAIALPAVNITRQVLPVVIKQRLGKKLLSGITVHVHTASPEQVRYVGNVETKEAHFSYCRHIKDLEDSKKRAFFSFTDAGIWGYRICEECIAGRHARNR